MKRTLNASSIDFPDFERAFRTWENQAGYPLVTVHYDSDRESIVLTQERFIESNPNINDESSWYIPINFATQDNPNFDDIEVTHFMKDGDIETLIPMPNFNTSHWYILNKQQVGYYRVKYDTQNFAMIKNFLHSENFEQIHVVNRMHLLDDAFALAHESYHHYENAYELVTYLVNEKNFFPWDIFVDNINRLYDIYGPRDLLLNVRIFNVNLIELLLIFIFTLLSTSCIICRRISMLNINFKAQQFPMK